MLQTRRSPSCVWVASISDFWRDEDACQAKVTIGDGPLEVVRLWRIVNLGCKAAIRSEPFAKLYRLVKAPNLREVGYVYTQWHMFCSLQLVLKQ